MRMIDSRVEDMHDHPHPTPGHAHGHGHDDSIAEVLDLDATIHRPFVEALLDRVTDLTDREPRTIVDLGAGTGAGTLALARLFPSARIVAIDSSDAMLARLTAAARRDGVDDRVRTVEADLDTTWPDVGSLDLAWAALSLHHVADPDAVIGRVADALEPGGLFVVTEMPSQPRFLPDDIGIGTPGLEARCHAASAAQGWNFFPDWSDHLRRAGLEVVHHRSDDLHVEVDDTVRRYARAVTARTRTGLADLLSTEDLATLDRLLGDGPDALRHRDDLHFRGTRTVWIARRPAPRDRTEEETR